MVGKVVRAYSLRTGPLTGWGVGYGGDEKLFVGNGYSIPEVIKGFLNLVSFLFVSSSASNRRNTWQNGGRGKVLPESIDLT